MDANNGEIYVGRLCGNATPKNEEWNRQIACVEKLLIYAHAPACNSQFINRINESDVEDIHVYNWETN